jgi:drug/metabolite transporter (DMT)-like permease
MTVLPWLWAIFTVIASAGQVLRNALQRELVETLGTVGATHVRFLFGLPFALLFLPAVLLLTGEKLPTPTLTSLAWVITGGLAQIGATALLLAAMKERSFVVVTAYSKTEPVQVALFGLVFLGDQLTWPLMLAILIATVGVMVMSWPKPGSTDAVSMTSVLQGLASASLFGVSAIGFRGCILTLDTPSFVVGATTTLVMGLAIQTATLTLYLYLFDREKLFALFRAWRPSLLAGFVGASASQFWFLAFAIESAAKVRTLALIELLFAQAIMLWTGKKKTLDRRETFGIALIVIGVVLLLNFERLGLAG